MNKKPTQAFSVRLPKEISHRLDAFSERTDRSKSYIATRAIVEYLDRYEGFVYKVLNEKDKIKRTRTKLQEQSENLLSSST